MWGLLFSPGSFWRIAGGGGGGGAAIVLSDSSISENASVGDLVGTLSVQNGSGTYAFTITLNDYFEIDGVDDTRVEVKAALDVGVHSITFQADNGVDDPLERTIPITVTAVVVVPSGASTYHYLGF